MKKWILFLGVLCMGYHSLAQSPIPFLGIPVEGEKEQMIQALQQKGFVYDAHNDCLEGEFNGYESNIYVVMNNDQIWRICVADVPSFDKNAIKIRYNKLFDQLVSCGKYDLYKGSKLSADEDVAYEITSNSKQYISTFVPTDNSIRGTVWYTIAEHYGNYFIMMFYENLDNQPE